MAWPKGVPRGPQGLLHKATRLAAVSEGQRRRWADPEKRARAIAGCHKSWDTGGRANDRVVWTPEMDAALREIVVGHNWAEIRENGPRLLGVGDRTMMTRIKTIGLKAKGWWSSSRVPKKPARRLVLPLPLAKVIQRRARAASVGRRECKACGCLFDSVSKWDVKCDDCTERETKRPAARV